MASAFTRPYPARVLGTAAATATRDDPVLICPMAGNVTVVTIATQATLTGQATDNKTLAIINKGQNGVGTAVVASKTFATGGDVATAFKELAIPVSATPANVLVAAGDVLALSQIKVGNGVLVPDLLVKISVVASD